MKPAHWIMMLSVAVGIGFLLGRQSGDHAPPEKSRIAPVRESRVERPTRSDPFGGPAFSLNSLEEVRNLFKTQRPEIASARLAISVEALSAKDIPEVMEMVQKDFRENPDIYDRSRSAMMTALFGRWTAIDPDAALAFVHASKQRSFKNQAAYSCYTSLAQADPGRAVAEMKSLPKGELRENVTPGIINALGKKDPAAACDLLESEPSRSGFSGYYASEIFKNWAKEDPKAAAARLSRMPDQIVDGSSAANVATAWAKTDPEAALAWAKSLKGERKTTAAVGVYAALAREDPAAAWEKIKNEPAQLRGKLSAGVLNVVADEEPQKAFDMLKGMESPSERRIATSQLMDQIGWSNPRLAFDFIRQIDDSSTRREQLGNLLYYATWSSNDLLKEQAAKLTDRERLETANQVLGGLTRSDPEAAKRYFLALPETQRTTQELSNMMQQYAGKDAKGALDFAMSLGNPKEQTAALGTLFSSWSAEDPKAAAEGLTKIPAGDTRLNGIDRIASSWAETDPTAAKQWADGLGGTERVRALASILPEVAKDDPAKASTQLLALLASPPDGMTKSLADSAASVASTWASDHPGSAAQWASSLPEGQWKDQSLAAVSASWSQYDAIAAAQWIETLPSGSSRDAAVMPLVSKVMGNDPATAFSWAASINDPTDRIGQLEATLQSWRGTDLTAARAALDGLDVTADERTKLQEKLK